ncbi:ester cyclase [Chloroflexota bacterium]
MIVEENKAVVLSFINDVWGKKDLSLVDDMIADDHVHHFTSRDVHGPEGVKQLVTWAHNFLPDAQIAIKDLIAEEDRVVVSFAISGTDKGGYKGNPPSGNSVEYDGIDIFRLAGGKIVERWGIVDTFRMRRQIGAIPEQGTSHRPYEHSTDSSIGQSRSKESDIGFDGDRDNSVGGRNET